MTSTEEEAKKKVRLRLRDDFKFYSEKALKIRTKDAQIVPFKLNAAQEVLDAAVERQMASEGLVRVIILKARQQGLSTYVGGRLYSRVSQRKAKKAIVVTHHSDSTKALFNMTKRYHENVPKILQPSTNYASRRELSFDKLDSSYIVATAGGEAIARGETLTHAHVSELAFWKESSARDNLNGLLQSIPDSSDTEVYIESTANGVTGPFYEMWKGAERGENGYIPVFIPWFLDPGYKRKAPKRFERTPEEDEVSRKAWEQWHLELTDDQLYWRRVKINEGGPDKFKQEYPAEPDEAFLTTGRPVFDPEQTIRDIEKSPAPIRRMSYVIGRWENSPTGELTQYAEIDPGETYYIGADVAMGVRNGDYSVAQVLDSSKRQVAVWRGHAHPDYYAEILNKLGRLYNQALIGVESNNHGLLTVNSLYKEWQYPHVYTNEIEDDENDIDTTKLGFRTDAKSKPMIIDELRASLRKRELKTYCKVTMKEMLTFVVKESGKIEAEEGCHDDCVMSLAIANHIHEGVWKPIELSDDDFIEAI